MASQNGTVRWQAEGEWRQSWSDAPHLWLLDVAMVGVDLSVCCEWWHDHCAHIPMGLMDSRRRQVSEADQIQVQRWGVLGLLLGFDREHLSRAG